MADRVTPTGLGQEAAAEEAKLKAAFREGYMARPCLDEDGRGLERAWAESRTKQSIPRATFREVSPEEFFRRDGR
jgi:hypothetical protein